MKNFRLSKMAWLILSAGIFVVVLAGLGLTYSGQKREQGTLNTELQTAKMRLEKSQDTGAQQQQLDQLKERLTDSQSRLTEAKNKLLQAILSVDVVEKFFQIAQSSEVTVTNISTTGVQAASVSGVQCSKISITATVQGDMQKLIGFVINLNENFITGYVASAQITIQDSSSASVQMEVYSSKGS